ncbi:MAG: hypothetical protein L0219_15920 [Phycisphaerales bacterium]|nr:hypothetical protein [Phycisphaerales bacterium]
MNVRAGTPGEQNSVATLKGRCLWVEFGLGPYAIIYQQRSHGEVDMARLFRPFVAVACACLMAAAPAETDYQIKMARPVKVGDQFRISASGSESTT